MLELEKNNDERNNSKKNDIRDAFRGERLKTRGVPLDAQRIISVNEPIKHERDTTTKIEKDTSERKLKFKF